MTDLAARLVDAEARLEAVKRTSGQAMLEGRDIDHMAMAAIEAEISSIYAAGGEIARREREEATATERARRDGLRQKLERLNQDRLEAAEQAEKAARDLCEAGKLWIAANGDCARIVRALNASGGGAGVLDASETETRLSLMLTNVLKPLVGLRRKFGMIAFPDALSRFADNWADVERANTETEILAVLKGADA
ncbi:hypothetical protein FJ955_03900 [Mesorhizobium sp. B2-2-2]|uniref:hypothetical protein n=1 Tax=Mesorhizobium sp. B2-2-2 TaxID=2589964 RepID=UPI001128AE80|nr:hypothetical protein [Mesorhizobium sp. B2-2-2]TPM33887.1 hypothetical protein FJ955_03900 [Mesorhizobium sp. B2-2-2]